MCPSPSTASSTLSDGLRLSVVVVTPERFRNIRRTVRHLRAQTARHALELIVVAPTQADASDHEPHELQGFGAVQLVEAGPIDNVDHAAAAGIRAARSPVVAIIEDHAFPDAAWAEAIMAAHEGPWGVVGSTIMNANPDSTFSWTNLLIAYGWWTDPAEGGETQMLPGHNISYKQAALEAYEDRLPEMLGRSGGLLDDLLARGYRFYVEPRARIYHTNPSLLRSTVDLRFSAGRLYGATRARREGWSPAKRAFYTAAGPLIPLIRLKRVHEELFAGGQRAQLTPRVYPGLFFGLVLDGLGQMTGYAFGPGTTAEKLSTFEMDRAQHLTVEDQQSFAS